MTAGINGKMQGWLDGKWGTGKSSGGKSSGTSKGGTGKGSNTGKARA